MRAAVSTASHLRAKQVGELDERTVAGLVAELVVDLLEPVEIGDEQRERTSGAPGARELARVGGREPATVRESGEWIACGRSPGARR